MGAERWMGSIECRGIKNMALIPVIEILQNWFEVLRDQSNFALIEGLEFPIQHRFIDAL